MNNCTPYCIVCGMGCDFMKQYDIHFEGNVVGNATIEIHGLFAEFHCVCRFPVEDVYRITVKYDDAQLDLGVCVPRGDCFTVKKQIPVKQLGTGIPSFIAVNSYRSGERFIPLCEDAPFLNLPQLLQCRFAVKGNVAGIILPNQD